MNTRLRRACSASLASKVSQKLGYVNRIASSSASSDSDGGSKSRRSFRKRAHVEIEYEDISKPSVKKENDSPPNCEQHMGPETEEEAALWQIQLANIQEMRKNKDAPVDSMGCDVISDKNASQQVILGSCRCILSMYAFSYCILC